MKMRVNFVIWFGLLAAGTIEAQVNTSANFIKGGENDAKKIISAYLLPVERALCFNGANNNMLIFKQNDKVDFRFGVGLDITASFVNANDFTYDVSKLNLEEFEPANPQQTMAQTMAGNENTIVLQTKNKYRIPSTSYPFYSEKPILTLNSPKGKNRTNIPFPLLHLFAEKKSNLIDVKILPAFKIENSTLGLFNVGINIQHNVETSLEFLSNLWFNIYISAGYNYNQITYYLDIKPDETALTFSPQSDNGPYDNQEFQIHSKSIPLKLSMVKQVDNFSFSLGCAYNATSSEVKMAGNYPVYTADPANLFQIIATDITDPFQYTRTFNKFSVEAGVIYQAKHFLTGLKYTHSYYKNIDLSLGYMF